MTLVVPHGLLQIAWTLSSVHPATRLESQALDETTPGRCPSSQTRQQFLEAETPTLAHKDKHSTVQHVSGEK